MIEAWLQRQGLERDAVHIRFYSDHVSDASSTAGRTRPSPPTPTPA